METAELKKREGQIKFAVSAYKRLPGNRAYALDEHGAEALGALAKQYFASNEGVGTENEFGKVLIELGDHVPALFQPKEEPLKLPDWPRHPITGALMPSPWEKGSESLSAQSKLLARDPELAKAMKVAAENPWQFYFDVEEQKQKREHVAAIKYTEEDHKQRNPYVSGGLKEQSELVKRDPVRAAVFKREAETLKLPFAPGSVNETVRGQLYVRAPKLYQWTESARATCERWQAERIAALKEAEEQARQDREKIEKQLRREEAA